MRAAVTRILAALDSRERIVLFGDYDVDGVTSLALLAEMLRGYGATTGTLFAFADGRGLRIEPRERRTLPSSNIAHNC